MKKSLLIGLLIYLFVSPGTVLAAQTFSNTVKTTIGNPATINSDTSGGRSGTRQKAPAPTTDLRQSIIQQFGITMNGFDNQHLQWAWEKFWDISDTNYFLLAGGTVINAKPGGFSQQLGCKTISFGRDLNETAFKVTLLHEMGHVIYWCNPDSKTYKTDHLNAFATEGGVTGYGASACFGTPPVTEDYPETIAYYLNPGIKEITPCNNRNRVPYSEGKYQLHYNVAGQILGAY